MPLESFELSCLLNTSFINFHLLIGSWLFFMRNYVQRIDVRTPSISRCRGVVHVWQALQTSLSLLCSSSQFQHFPRFGAGFGCRRENMVAVFVKLVSM